MSDDRKRLDSVERLAKSAVDALEMIAEQHFVLARLLVALIAEIGADDAGLSARLAAAVEAQGGELTETQRQFMANFIGGGADLSDAEQYGLTAH
jgi:hypothetical protein